MLTLNNFGKSHVSWGNPIKTVNYPFSCFFSPTIYFCQNVVEVVIAGKGKSMGKFELGRAPSFECRVLTSWERKTPKTICQFGLMHYIFIFGFTFWELRDILLFHYSPFG